MSDYTRRRQALSDKQDAAMLESIERMHASRDAALVTLRTQLSEAERLAEVERESRERSDVAALALQHRLDKAVALLRRCSKTWDNPAYEDGDAELDMENIRAFLASTDKAARACYKCGTIKPATQPNYRCPCVADGKAGAR